MCSSGFLPNFTGVPADFSQIIVQTSELSEVFYKNILRSF